MKKTIIGLAFVLLGALWLSGQQAFQEISLVVNIEVPVRVFDGTRFVDDLTIKDFEILEDGIPQKIEAVYLVKKKSIERSDERKRFSPETKRHYFLFFEVAEYSPRLEEAVEYLVENILYPGDDLVVTTPLKTYRLVSRAFEAKPRDAITQELKAIIRRDTEHGNREYRDTLRDLSDLARDLASHLGISDDANPMAPPQTQEADDMDRTFVIHRLLLEYADLLGKLENLRKVDQMRLLDFAEYLKNKQGQKYVFMFYQREFIPKVDTRLVNQLKSLYQNEPSITHNLTTVLDFYTREKTFDVERVKRAYADATTAIHFLFISERPAPVFGVRMEEHSEDIFSAFREMARATGGLVISSSRPDTSFQQALDASENYYLLYYSPKDYRPDGGFREIKVLVKGKTYRVTHRAGYFAN